MRATIDILIEQGDDRVALELSEAELFRYQKMAEMAAVGSPPLSMSHGGLPFAGKQPDLQYHPHTLRQGPGAPAAVGRPRLARPAGNTSGSGQRRQGAGGPGGRRPPAVTRRRAERLRDEQVRSVGAASAAAAVQRSVE
ncbi:MAG TPA: hypothetical protein VM142_03595 [Acidimicrobiales bacterium]|nr:hypothetical protein [Acidimicrobiales bacterium]